MMILSIRGKLFRNNAGFTLIELLVVLSIIGMLASVILASLNNARLRARDTKRIGSLNQLKVALSLYNDTNKAYPSIPTPTWVTSTANTCTWISLGLSPQYISCTTSDPINSTCAAAPASLAASGPWTGGTNYCYAYSSAAGASPQTYDLVTLLEDTTNPYTCTNKHWVYHTNPGGEVSWCPPTTLNGGTGYSTYMYADH